MIRRTGVLALAMLLVVSLSVVNSAEAQNSLPSLNVNYYVTLSPHYSIYGSVMQRVSLEISGNANSEKAVSFQVVYLFDLENVTLPKSDWTVIEISQHPVENLLTATIPGPVGRFDFTVTGAFPDESLLYRDSATIPYAEVYTNSSQIGGPTSYTVNVKLAPQTEVLSTFPTGSVDFPVQTSAVAGTNLIVANFPTVRGQVPSSGWIYFVVLYQPPLYNWFLILYIAIIMALIVFWRKIFGKIIGPLVAKLLQALSSSKKMAERLDYKRLLAVLVAASVLMIGLALVFGPSPTPRVYLAATPSTTLALAPTVMGTGFSYLTPANASDEFDTLSNFGVFHSVVIADYPPPINSEGLRSAYRIIVLSNYAPPAYVAGLDTFYSGHVKVVNNTLQLENALAGQRLTYSGNNLGLGFGQGAYGLVVPLEAILSLTIPFLALAFLSRFIIEEGGLTLWKIGLVIPAAILVFLFAEFAYIQTDVLLGIPVALHAAVSSAETAGGAIGFGGGSKPRLVMGALGFMFGILCGKGGTLKLDRTGLLVFLGGLAFLVADPLTGGQAFYNLLIVGLTPDKGTAVGIYSWLGVRSFLGQFMNLFGNYTTLTYFSQHGAVVFFVGVVPFVIYTTLRKTMATILALFSALLAGIGFVRIGDQIPEKAIASAMPGILIGFIFLGAFLVLGITEGYLRKRIGGS